MLLTKLNTYPAGVHILGLQTEVVIMDHVRNILLPHNNQLDGLPGLFDDLNGIVNIPGSLVVDGDDLVVLLHSVLLGLTLGHNPSDEYPGLLLLILVQTSVDQGETEAAGPAVHLDHSGAHGERHFSWERQSGGM